MIPQARSSTCPVCGGEILSRWIATDWFPGRIPSCVFCYNCGAALRVRRSYFSALYFVALVSMVLAAYAIGIGGYDNAQEGFPLRAELRLDTIAFTNLSDENWKCEILLGSSVHVGAALQLPSHQTREIAYADFRPSLFMIRSAELRSAAREELLASCTEPPGRFRSGLLR